MARPYDGYRTSSFVADSSRLCPASNLPAFYPLGYGAYLYVDPRFCLRLPSGAHRCYTLAFGYPSPPSGWVWTLPDICVINIDHHHLAAGPCPAHNHRMNSDRKKLLLFPAGYPRVVEDASRPRQRAADFIRRLLGAPRLTTSECSRLGLRQTAFASSLAPDPQRVRPG